ncbi:MAG TPA: NADH:ubiquinone oxidoreductase [Anaerolineae bacterium]|nr:NADH:ubiquinone oxidoreductase [Anaerolineae bacterium]
MNRPKIAFFDFTGCEGCQLTVIDSLQTHPELLDAVDIVQFREAMTDAPRGEDYQIAFVEGSCARKSDEDRLTHIRQQAEIVVALGACAHLGGINAIRNRRPLDEVCDYVYGEMGDWYVIQRDGGARSPRLRLNDQLVQVDAQARPIEAVIQVDAVVPGCPIDREEFVRVAKELIQGRRPGMPDYPVCVECKLRENVCLFHRGQARPERSRRICLGPVARAGCGALCPTYGTSCEGCRGLISNPNLDAMHSVLDEAGLTAEDIMTRFTLFGTYQLAQRESERQAEKA